jgi:hypothetical protein
MKSTKILSVLLAALVILGSSVAYAAGPDDVATYRVTIQNLSIGQPLSPPVAATHGRGIRMFKAGELASSELEALAEDGNHLELYDLFSASDQTTDVVDVGAPLTPLGKTVGDFSDSISFEIEARPGDKLSLASMLICSNDGFVGLGGVRLPRRGFGAYLLRGYDAGTEDNTEMSQDIVDPCSALGPFPLDGDPNGNEDAAVDSDPQQTIRRHPGIRGVGDLSIFEHGWIGPVGVIVVRRVN